jgi:phospholipid/cholesterol/gamma-HCH transport system substrate-binding protein
MTRRTFSRPVRHQPSVAFVVAVGLAAIGLLCYFAYAGFTAANSVPWQGYYDVNAELPQADSLHKQDAVRIGADYAGKVISVEASHGYALLHLRLYSNFGPLRSNSTFRVRLQSAVGERYLQIIPSTIGTPVPQNGVLMGQELQPVDLDQILSTLDPRTRAGTQTYLNELGTGTVGRGEDINSTLAQAPSFLAHTGNVLRAIAAVPGGTGRTTAAMEAAASAFEPVSSTAAAGFSPENAAMRAFADRANAVGETFAQAAPTLSQSSQQLPTVTALVDQLNGLAVQARATLPAAPAALRATSTLLAVARQPIANLRTTLTALGSAVQPTVTLLQRIVPVLPYIDQTMRDVRGTVQYLAPRSCELSNVWTGWSEWMKYGTDFSNAIRFEAYPLMADGVAGITATRGQLLNQLEHENPYPGPCVNGAGERGGPAPSPQVSAEGLPFDGRGG